MEKGGRRQLCCVVIGLAIICIILVAVLIAVSLTNDKTQDSSCTKGDNTLDLSQPQKPSVFHDLTQKELTAVKNYLYSLERFKLLAPPNYKINASYLFAVYPHLPPKADVLKYLDNGGPQPTRKARVVLFRGNIVPPVVEEYVVEPLPDPTSCTLLSSPSRKNPVDFALRPFSFPEFIAVYFLLFKIDAQIGYILKESYDATFTDCGSKCLITFPTAVSSPIGVKRRKIWFRAERMLEQENLHTVDFEFLVDAHGVDPDSFFVDKVMYAGQPYSSIDDLAGQYNSSNIPKTKIPFPANDENLFSTMNLRGEPFPDPPKAPPRLFEPDGRRFSIQHNKISYMKWQMEFSMHPLFGPRIYDVRFGKDRIAYEISLQEIAVFYSGKTPSMRTANYIDSVSNIGIRSVALMPGSDCPVSSEFLSSYVLNEVSNDPYRLERHVCVFEQNTGVPLRRRLALDLASGRYHYAGMEDSVLVVRSIHSIGNYDYLIDFILHQNGGLESRVISTGILSTAYNIPGEDTYGFQIHENVVGNIHQHLFHFKVDLDIGGTSNRYETLDIGTELVDNSYTTDNSNKDFWQIKYDRNLKTTEMDAAYEFNFNNPKYHLLYNSNNTRSGLNRAYRIHSTGLHKQLLPENQGNEQAISWARYQAAFTKVKDDEAESSSMYGMMDAGDPVVNFTSFMSDNESIVDEDIVAWLTLGLYHIPHTEDLPVTATVGGHLGFFLLPYNYFEECPSVSSRDALRVDSSKLGEAKIKRYGNKVDGSCLPRQAVLDNNGTVKT